MAASYLMLILLIAVSIPASICIFRAGKYADYVNALSPEEFSGCKYFGIGFAFTDFIKYDFSSRAAHKVREQAGILYGRRYADFYMRALYAQKYTYSILLVYVALFLGCLVEKNDGLIMMVLGFAAAAAVFYYYSNSFDGRIEKLNFIYMRDFPGAISTIALLVNAGMFLRDAWKQVAYSSDEPLYMQMRIVVDDMNNGVSEADAIFAFANRCSTKEIRKFATLITQAIEKGGSDLTDSLTKQAGLLMNEKRQLTLQQGEKASSKLMIPIVLIFVGILIIIMLPILANLNL